MLKQELLSLQDNSVKYFPCTTAFSLLSAAFWKALGGKGDYQTSKTLRNVVKLPRLFACSNKTGNLIVSIQIYDNVGYGQKFTLRYYTSVDVMLAAVVSIVILTSLKW